MTTLYGLVAHGSCSATGRSKHVYSKKLFRSFTAAENYQQEFLNRCCDNSDGRLSDLDKNERVTFSVVKFECEPSDAEKQLEMVSSLYDAAGVPGTAAGGEGDAEVSINILDRTRLALTTREHVAGLEEWKADQQKYLIEGARLLAGAGYKGAGMTDGIKWIVAEVERLKAENERMRNEVRVMTT